MENKETQWISKKELVAPVMSIVAFLLLLVGASYAYYSQSVGAATGAANIANINMTIMRGCTFLSSATKCTITANNSTVINASDSVITRGEMIYNRRNNQAAVATCNLNIGVGGAANCGCTYSVSVVASTAVPSGIANSVTMTIGSTITSHNLTERNIAAATVVSSNILRVATTGTNVYENFSLTLKAYNRDAVQDPLAGSTYVYYLRATPSDCLVAK